MDSKYFERRMCVCTSRPICAKDTSSVQIAIAELGEDGISNGQTIYWDLSGQARKNEGNADKFILDLSRQN